MDVEALVARGWRATSAGCAGRRRRLSPCSGAWCSGDPHNELRAEHLWTGALACRARPGSARCPGSARRLVQAPPGRAPMITSALMVLTCLAARSFFRAKLLHQKHWCSDHREAWTYFRAGAHNEFLLMDCGRQHQAQARAKRRRLRQSEQLSSQVRPSHVPWAARSIFEGMMPYHGSVCVLLCRLAIRGQRNVGNAIPGQLAADAAYLGPRQAHVKRQGKICRKLLCHGCRKTGIRVDYHGSDFPAGTACATDEAIPCMHWL